MALHEPLVDALVPATDQNHARPARQFAHQLLADGPPLRGHENHGGARHGCTRRLYRGPKLGGAHDHPGASAVGGVVHRTMAPGREVARIEVGPARRTRRLGATGDAERERPGEELGEEGHQPHAEGGAVAHMSSSGRTTTVRATRSTCPT